VVLFIIGSAYYYIYYNSPKLFIKKTIDQALKDVTLACRIAKKEG